MKIGILTFHNAYNYGAVLQAYATQKFLESKGYKSEIIDYRNERIDKRYKQLHFRWNRNVIKKPHLAILMAIKSIFQNKKERKFDLFKNQEMCISTETYTKKHPVDAQNYDIIIVGSDQIWNPKLTKGFDEVYFGVLKNSNHTKIISWSPSSIYLDYTEEEIKQLSKLIQNISHLSVRDEGLKEILKKITNRNVTLTLDPTFILKSNIWSKMCHDVKEKNYILVYAVRHRDETWALAKKIAKKYNKRLIEVKNLINGDFHSYVRNTCSPDEFLSYIYHADYIVSSSFHGTAFSILFEKQFVNYVPKSSVDSRVRTILEALGLEDRAANEDYDITNISSVINYSEVEKRLDSLRDKSIDFLISAIEN